MQFPIFLRDADSTDEFGQQLSTVLSELLQNTELKSCLIFLHGDLGAGKTSLVRACLRHLGVKGAIKSPTYTLLEPYEVIFSKLNSVINSQKKLKIAHLDLYRLQEPEELDYIGGRDLKENYQVIFVEWPNKALGFIPQSDINIQLNHKDTGRELYIESQHKFLQDKLNSL